MYPFGTGMPPNQQQQQTPYPPNQRNTVPFGAGAWVQPGQSAGHQNIYASEQNKPYPTQPNYNNPPYPTSQNQYPSSQTQYPPTQPKYPPSQPQCASSQPSNPTGYPPYPVSTNYQNQSFNTPYPPNNYPGSQTNMPAVPFGAGFYAGGSTTGSTSTYSMPNVSQNINSQQPGYSNYPSSVPHPNQNSNAPYPTGINTHQNPIAASNMVQCFNEMRQSIAPINSPNTNSSREKGTPTVTPALNFDPVKDAHALRKAMKGFGTDEDALIEIICRRSNEQRQEIQRQYKTHFGKDLIEDIKSETSGNFEKLLVGLLRPIVDFYCVELYDAMKGIGTDEDVLIEILCTLSNSEIHAIKNHYLRMYGAHLESELKSETSGNFKRLLVSLCTAARDESGRIDPAAAQNDARELLKAGELRVGTDESMFNMVLCQRNYQQLKMILNEYENITGHSLEKAIKREFSGDIQEGLLAICKCVTNKAEYFASRLHKSMAGFGTNDRQLIRVIITRCEIDMQDIKVTFERMYGKSLKSWIKGDTSGDYKHALYALIGEQRSS